MLCGFGVDTSRVLTALVLLRKKVSLEVHPRFLVTTRNYCGIRFAETILNSDEGQFLHYRQRRKGVYFTVAAFSQIV